MPASLNSLSDWLHYLESLHPSAIEMGLERVSQVASRLLDLNALPAVVTVTGTNGKGSTVMSMEAVSLAHGKRVGTYMSPHLLRYNERVRINGQMVSDLDLIESFQAVEQARGEISLTYFEFGTLSALWLFARTSPDILLLEVGLGGRLDAVNVIDPDVAIITSIALDHESWLGSTREQVCYEKAGIRRSGVPLICGDRHPPENLFELCNATNTPLVLLGRDFDVKMGEGSALPDAQLPNRESPDRESPDRESPNRESPDRESPHSETLDHKSDSVWTVPNNALLPDNMVCALQALHLAQRFPVDRKIAWQALTALVIPGRRQLLQQQPDVYVDVGHNPHAALSLAEWIRTHFRRPGKGRVIGLVGMLSDKDYTGTLQALLHSVDLWQPVTLGGPRGLSGENLATILREAGATVLLPQASPVDGLLKILEQAQIGDTIIGFGSFYTVSDLLAHYASGAHGN